MTTTLYKVRYLDPESLSLLTVEVEDNIGSPGDEIIMRLTIPPSRESNVVSQSIVFGWQDSGSTTLTQFRDYLLAIDPTLVVVATGTMEPTE